MIAAEIIANSAPIVLTGDRPTGPLHLGHWVGSLQQRLLYQQQYQQLIMIADAQALTDHMDDTQKITRHVFEVALDYLAVGIDPKRSTIFVQSQIPELAELSFYYLNLVTLARLERNPTVKEELRLRNFERDIPVGFLAYPVSQAADITAFQASLVPVGEDQIPMIEQTNEIVRRFNRMTHSKILREVKAIVPRTGRLPGIDGKAKMSKSLGNAIPLHASKDELRRLVKKIYTDPLHLRIDDPGHLENNIAFLYLDIFDPDQAGLSDLKKLYVAGGIADSLVKTRLEDCLHNLLDPIRERRKIWEKKEEEVWQILRQGCETARSIAAQTLKQVKSALGLIYPHLI